MAAFTLVPVNPNNLMEITPKNWHRYPPPVADMTLANPHVAKPRYDSMTDWHGGDTGEDVGQSDATQAIAGRNGGIDADYEPRHQEEKAQDMVPPLEVLADIGKDYGPYGGAYHSGTIEPFNQYPSVNTAQVPDAFKPASQLVIP